MRLPADGTLIIAEARHASGHPRLGADRPPDIEAKLASLRAAWRKEGLPFVDALGDDGASALAGGRLEALLDDAGATTLVLCGAMSAVAPTARDAANLGYHVFILLDACWPTEGLVQAAERLRQGGAVVVDTAAALGAAALAKARQRREAQRKR